MTIGPYGPILRTMIDASGFNRHSLFGGFSQDDLAKVAHLFEPKSFAAGDILLTEGEPNNQIFFLLSGSVRVTRGAFS